MGVAVRRASPLLAALTSVIMAVLWGCAAARYRSAAERSSPGGGTAPLLVSRTQQYSVDYASPGAAVERYMGAQAGALRQCLTCAAEPLGWVCQSEASAPAQHPRRNSFTATPPVYRPLAPISVRQSGEGIWVSIHVPVLFDSECGDLSESGKRALAAVADILRLYEGTHVLVVGQLNCGASDRPAVAMARERAASVVDQLLLQGIGPDRLSETVKWSTPPAADPFVRAARSADRIVLAIYATDTLREAAARGGLDGLLVEQDTR